MNGRRQIATPHGLHDVEVSTRDDGRATARLLDAHPALEGIGGAVGDDTDQAVQLLQEACERA